MNEEQFLDALKETTTAFTWELRGTGIIRTKYEGNKTHCPVSAVATVKIGGLFYTSLNTQTAAIVLNMSEQLREDILWASDTANPSALRLRMLQTLSLLPAEGA